MCYQFVLRKVFEKNKFLIKNLKSSTNVSSYLSLLLLKSENTHVCVYKPKKKAEFSLKRFYFDEVA